MFKRNRPILTLILLLAAAMPALAADLTFEVSFDAGVRKEPFTGRIIIFFGDKDDKEPRLDYTWTTRRPVFSRDVFDMQPGKSVKITDPRGFPHEVQDLPAGTYSVQAVMHTNPDLPHGGEAPGNLFSRTVIAEVANAPQSIRLHLDQQVPPDKRTLNSDTMRSVEMRSECLSRFHGRDVFLRAVLVLPPEYAREPDRRFPAIYIVPGFGGDHFMTAGFVGIYGQSKTPFVRVALDSRCALGHHVFADSDNNGPYGRAFVEEFIPWLEKEFRLISEPHARLLTGHSSGGWSTLWLQISYPDYFGGTWSTSPDPVDFHEFTGVNLYDRAANFFFDRRGEKRPVMRGGGKVRLWLRDFSRMEDVIGPGGQLHSFEAVFGPRRKNCGTGSLPVASAPASGETRSQPVVMDCTVPLWDRKAGDIDQEVMRAWRRYDIVDKLKREWPELGPKLRGKIHVLVGEEDNFYLADAVKLLRAALEKLGSDARVEIIPGKDHGSIIMTPQFRGMIEEMSKVFESATSTETPKPLVKPAADSADSPEIPSRPG